MILFLSLLSCSSPAPQTAPTTPAPVTVTEPATSLIPPDQKAVIDHAVSGLKQLCAKSARACELLDFFTKNSIEAVALPDGVRIVSAPDVQYPFLVIGIPGAHKNTGNISFSGARFGRDQGPVPIMELNGSDTHPLGAGLMLAHELTHAEEHFLHAEPMSEYPEPNWLISEGVAHHTVSVVLDQYTGGTWSKAIASRMDNIQEYLAKTGQDPKLAAFGRGPNDVLTIKATLPGADDVTIGALLAQMDIETSMARTRYWSAESKLAPDERQTALIATLKAFYEQMNYDPSR